MTFDENIECRENIQQSLLIATRIVKQEFEYYIENIYDTNGKELFELVKTLDILDRMQREND